MSEQFEVGEIAELKNLVGDDLVYNGKEVQITGPLQVRDAWCLVTNRHEEVLGYQIQFPDGGEFVVTPGHLRKKRPPTEYTGELRIMELFTKTPVMQPELETA